MIIRKNQWLTRFGDHTIAAHSDVQDAINWALRIVSWERNVRIVTPNGMRLTVQAASLLL